MTKSLIRTLVVGLAALPLATPALAQSDADRGIYAVARAGGVVGTQGKFDTDDNIFKDKTKYKTGVTGEIGGGYDFGMFRLEQTIGYTSTDLNRKKNNQDDFDGAGRNRMFTLAVSGFVDIPVSKTVVPYIGGGAGIARVKSRLSRVDTLTGDTSSYRDKDYGVLLHADAGVGVTVAPKTTVELGARYTRVSNLKFRGESNGLDTNFTPKLSSISGTLGLRYIF